MYISCSEARNYQDRQQCLSMVMVTGRAGGYEMMACICNDDKHLPVALCGFKFLAGAQDRGAGDLEGL